MMRGTGHEVAIVAGSAAEDRDEVEEGKVVTSLLLPNTGKGGTHLLDVSIGYGELL